VVAEALNNAIEHGFGAGGKGHVIVTVAPSEAGVSVTIADDGKGLPDGFDLEASDSLGLRIARTLTQSLGGRFTMAAAPVGRGAIARLEIALAQPDPPVLG
jgi:two-component sensor histidine kinase